MGIGQGHGGADAATGTGGAVGWGGFDASGNATGGGAGGSGGSDLGTDGSLGGTGGSTVSSVVEKCAVDSDCVAVLDYREGFQCYSPRAASLADLANDRCLVPWNPSNPRCPLVTPPTDCPGGLILVNHSCPAFCQFAICTGGTCTLGSDFSTPSRCAEVDAGAPPDCNALRAAYLAALADVQTCDPAKTPTSCFDAFYDGCGCPAAADLASPRADVLQCALDALQQARCGFGNCGAPCPSGSATPACTANTTGTLGTCTLVR